MIKLLCIDAKCNKPTTINPLREGATYTLQEDVTCSCGLSPKVITLEEQPAIRQPLRLRCMFCKRPRTFTHRPLAASRFIQINDPDATQDTEIWEAPFIQEYMKVKK